MVTRKAAKVKIYFKWFCRQASSTSQIMKRGPLWQLFFFKELTKLLCQDKYKPERQRTGLYQKRE